MFNDDAAVFFDLFNRVVDVIFIIRCGQCKKKPIG